MTHKFMKMGGVKTEKEFYKKYPTEEHFFAAFPHMREGGTPTRGQWDFPSDPSTPGYEDYGDMYSVPQYPGLMYKDPTGNAGWEGFGNPANLASNQGVQDMGYGPVRDMPTQQLAMDPSDYSIDKLRASQMKDGGYSNPPGMYWNGTSYVKAKGTGTYANGAYFKDGGKFNYNPFIRKNGNYWTYLDYIEDGGNIAQLKQGGPIGYVPGNINAQPQILKQTDGVYHMAHGGPIEYVPAPMTVDPQILKRTNGVAHMREGGINNPGFNALPVAVQEKIKARMEFGGVHMPTPIKKDGGYWKYYGYDEDGGNIAELAQGGPTDYASEQSPQYKKGGIHIKPENRGKFTAYKQRTGKTTEEALHSPDPHVRQMANFARNAAKWKHEYGGPAMMQEGGGEGPVRKIAAPAMSRYTALREKYPYLANNTLSGIDADIWQSYVDNVEGEGALGKMTLFTPENQADFSTPEFSMPENYYKLNKKFRPAEVPYPYTKEALVNRYNKPQFEYLAGKTEDELKQERGDMKRMGGRYMQEGGGTNPYANMVMGQIGQMQQKIGQLGEMVNQDTELEPWVTTKMTLANDYLNSVENYLEHNPEAQEAVMRMGGHMNPFSAIAQFTNGGIYEMQGGGAWGSSSMSNSNNLGFNPVAEANREAIKETELTQDKKPKVTPPRANMNETPFDATTLNDPYAAEEEEQQMIQTPEYMRRRPGYGSIALNGLAIGAGLVSAANRKKEIANSNIYNGGSWNMPFAQGSKGNDPNANRMSQPGAVISQPGNFAPYRAQMGGMMARNNMYQQGGVYDMDEAEIADLISKGYKVQYV